MHLAMYTYICMNACMCDVYVYIMSVYMCECMYICLYIMCVHVYMYICMNCMCVCMCVYMAHTYTYIQHMVYICVCVYGYIYIYIHVKFFIRFDVQYLLTFHSSLLYYNSIHWCWTANRNIYLELTQEDFLSFSQNTFVFLYICIYLANYLDYLPS